MLELSNSGLILPFLEGSVVGLENAKKDINAELDKIASGLVDSELACELNGIVK